MSSTYIAARGDFAKQLKSARRQENPTFKLAILTAIIFGSIVLCFTVLGVLIAPQQAQVGKTRPEITIPSHLVELAGVGALLGAGAAIFYGRRGLPLVLLTPTLTVLLDLDHLPAYLGIAQPIRPAHSLIFIVVVLILTTIVIRRPDFDLVVLSAVMGHMGVDTGFFAPLAPFTFDYVSLDSYRLLLIIGAGVAALAAGILVRRGTMRNKERG